MKNYDFKARLSVFARLEKNERPLIPESRLKMNSKASRSEPSLYSFHAFAVGVFAQLFAVNICKRAPKSYKAEQESEELVNCRSSSRRIFRHSHQKFLRVSVLKKKLNFSTVLVLCCLIAIKDETSCQV